jgi:hypothetical protein
MAAGALAFWALGFGLLFDTNTSGWIGTVARWLDCAPAPSTSNADSTKAKEHSRHADPRDRHRRFHR